jgi:ABC transport system ATP-binding/permease protein
LVAVFALKGLPEVKRLSLHVQTNVVENLAERLQYLNESFQVSSLVGGLSMFQVILLTLMGANNAAREIAKERQVLTKELRAGLSPPAYLLTKVGQVFGFSLLQSVLMAGLVKILCGFPGEAMEQFFILFMATFAMSCTCLFFSAISNTPERASLLSIYLVGLQLPLSGAVLALPEWLKEVTRPFITGYWGWSGYLRTFENFRHFDIVKQVSKTDIASYKLSIIVLSLHVIVSLSAALVVIYRKRQQPAA